MARSINIKAKQCCALEKDRLVKELRVCDKNSANSDERHLCYRRVAKESGMRSKECLI